VSGVTNTAARLIDNLERSRQDGFVYRPDDEIAGMLGEVSFDQLSVRVSRDPAANLWLTEFTLVSRSSVCKARRRYARGGQVVVQPAAEADVEPGVMGPWRRP